MKQYLDLVKRVLLEGARKENRTGVDTLSLFNHNYEVDLNQGFPLLTTKRISWKNIVIENLWFLSGRTDIGLLKKHGCHFWDAWADADGRVPSAYGNFWRRFPVHGEDEGQLPYGRGSLVREAYNDQVRWVIDELMKNPMSRRLVISAWAPGNAQGSKLPPCHALFALNVQNENVLRDDSVMRYASMVSGGADPELAWSSCAVAVPRLNLHLTQRSADIALGVPYNIAGYALLLSLFSRFSGISVGKFAHSIIDAHVYTSKPDGSMAEYDHVPGLKEQLTRDPRPLPSLDIDKSIKTLSDVEALLEKDTETIMSKFVLKNYEPHPGITFRVAV